MKSRLLRIFIGVVALLVALLIFDHCVLWIIKDGNHQFDMTAWEADYGRWHVLLKFLVGVGLTILGLFLIIEKGGAK